ncbi:MAG TPA: transposase [Anaerolineales bacterium]|nr:transposase [Anaerolineales bacterium]
MLPLIVQHSEALISFVFALQPALFQPQLRHLLQIVDALLVCNQRKTLSNLSRLLHLAPDPKALADFFRESPWTVDLISQPRKQFMVCKLLELATKAGIPLQILASLDDSLGKKGKATKHLEAVDYHHNHTESTRKRQAWCNGYVYVELHLQIGPFGFLFDTRLYLREKKVRQLNRQRSKDKRLSYRSKYNLAREMLLELDALLPAGSQVYVLFDSWYASAKLINLCLRRNWQVICALKANRKIEKQRIDRYHQTLSHKPYQRITLEAVDDRRARTYDVRTVRGHLEDIRQEVYVILSKKRPGDPRPKYFLCTDTDLSAEEALKIYQKRWPVEVDNLNLKEVLGLGDFRLQSFEAIQKWFAVVNLAINYLQYTAMLAYRPKQVLPSLAECKRQHQQAHVNRLLRRLVTEIKKKPQRVEAILQAYLPMYAADT